MIHPAQNKAQRGCVGLIAACAAALAACDSRECAAPQMPTGEPPAWAPAPPVAPISFFENACANCHGPHGMFYGEGFAALPDDSALTHAVREMVIGPARTTLDEASTAALVAYHRHLARSEREPFVVITRIDGSAVEGEVSPGARVVVVADGLEFEARVDGHAWTARLDSAPVATLVVRSARQDDGSCAIELDARAAAWTHRGPE
ncbi:MAG: hypothetical protein KF699_01215 [Phycisphaeraceae bacterium]|nr:hypothetical protein [Phycisphaeraceae bacterium]